MKETFYSGTTGRVSSINGEVERLLNLIDSRLRRKEVALAEKFAEELLDKTMKFLLHQKVARMNRLNRFLFGSMQLLLLIVFASVVCMVMNIQPHTGLKVFAAGFIVIALLAMLNFYLFGRFCQGMQSMTETYMTESKRFVNLLLESVRGDNNPETALDMFRLAIMR
jgi:hypothetical protein